MKRLTTLFITLITMLLGTSGVLAVNITATAHVENIGDTVPVTGSTVSIGTKG